MKTRKKFSPEYKQEAVDLVRRTGQSANQIAKELGIPQTSLSRWLRGSAGHPEDKNSFPIQEENQQLRQEVNRLKMERDILKKATAFFARESL
ncbi:MAG: hypothetical protein A2W28_02315 [Gammaproteobacteria bacterium RBG_16_51_14]|nr:MAG: hypothetical protein A2W28_02315 [Gammaproteobacteria bacterium RBG_16_51_14]